MAKTKPGQIQYASSSAGGLTHFAGELFNVMAGVKMTMVPYEGGAPAGMSHGIVTRLSQEIGAIVREPESVRWFTSQAADSLSATPDEFSKLIASDIGKWQKAAREAGISIQ
jgi:tripartite-type tricarboxylate transporter receptor subunit TctC